MSRSQDLQAWMREHANSEETKRTLLEIREAMGGTIRQNHSTVGELRRTGFIESSGPIRCKGYWFTGKAPARSPIRGPVERAAHNRERLAKRRRAKGMRTRAEWYALIAARRAEREAAKPAKAPRVPKPAKVKAVPKPKAPAKPKVTPKLRVTVFSASAVATPSRRDVSADVAAWMASGGRVERLSTTWGSP